MNHSEKYETVLGYYMNGLWDINRVRNAVAKGWITSAEYTEITGQSL